MWLAAVMMLVVVVVGVAAARAVRVGGGMDFVVGVTVAGAGLVLISRRGWDGAGALLAGAGLLWFGGDLVEVQGVVGEVAGRLQFVHRSLIALAVLLPAFVAIRRVRNRQWIRVVWCLVASIAGLVCAVGVIRDWSQSWLIQLIVAAVVAIVAVIAVGRVPRRWPSTTGAISFVVAMAAVSVLRRFHVLSAVDRKTTLQVGLLITAMAVAWSRMSRLGVDRVVQLGSSTDRDPGGIGRAVFDADLRVGFSDAGGFRSVDGQLVSAGGGQRALLFEFGEDLGSALVVHSDGMLADARILPDLDAALRILASHHRLTEQVVARAASIEASRQRLIADEERAIETVVADVQRRVLPLLERVVAMSGGNSETTQSDQFVHLLVDDVLGELATITSGIEPIDLDRGLLYALQHLVDRCALPSRLEVNVEVDEPLVRRALYFTAAEGLANAVKHSGASSVAVSVSRRGGDVELTVTDDGRGGAIDRAQGGLRGLVDRLAALGGTLRIDTPVGGGTVVTARVRSP